MPWWTKNVGNFRCGQCLQVFWADEQFPDATTRFPAQMDSLWLLHWRRQTHGRQKGVSYYGRNFVFVDRISLLLQHRQAGQSCQGVHLQHPRPRYQDHKSYVSSQSGYLQKELFMSLCHIIAYIQPFQMLSIYAKIHRLSFWCISNYSNIMQCVN